jgi:hypothetical protein
MKSQLLTTSVLNQYNIPRMTGPRSPGDGILQLYWHDLDGHLVELHTLIEKLKKSIYFKE